MGLLGACASAPINLVGDETGLVAAAPAMSPERADLHQAAVDLNETYERNAWSRATHAMSAARRWAGRLTMGGDEAEAEDPVDLYLRTRGQDSEIDPGLVIEDIGAARRLADRVENAAQAFLTSESRLSIPELTEDLALVERSITLTRRAMGVFDATIDRLGDRLSAQERQALTAERDAFAQASERLSDRADELARMRRNARSGVFG